MAVMGSLIRSGEILLDRCRIRGPNRRQIGGSLELLPQDLRRVHLGFDPLSPWSRSLYAHGRLGDVAVDTTAVLAEGASHVGVEGVGIGREEAACFRQHRPAVNALDVGGLDGAHDAHGIAHVFQACQEAASEPIARLLTCLSDRGCQARSKWTRREAGPPGRSISPALLSSIDTLVILGRSVRSAMPPSIRASGAPTQE